MGRGSEMSARTGAAACSRWCAKWRGQGRGERARGRSVPGGGEGPKGLLASVMWSDRLGPDLRSRSGLDSSG